MDDRKGKGFRFDPSDDETNPLLKYPLPSTASLYTHPLSSTSDLLDFSDAPRQVFRAETPVPAEAYFDVSPQNNFPASHSFDTKITTREELRTLTFVSNTDFVEGLAQKNITFCEYVDCMEARLLKQESVERYLCYVYSITPGNIRLFQLLGKDVSPDRHPRIFKHLTECKEIAGLAFDELLQCLKDVLPLNKYKYKEEFKFRLQKLGVEEMTPDLLDKILLILNYRRTDGPLGVVLSVMVPVINMLFPLFESAEVEEILEEKGVRDCSLLYSVREQKVYFSSYEYVHAAVGRLNQKLFKAVVDVMAHQDSMRTKKAIDEAIKRGMHPNTQDEKTGDTLVHLVIQALCTRNYTEIQIPLLSLLDAGADFNVRNKQGETSLHVARRCLFNAESFYLWLKNECHVIPELVNEAGKVALPYSRDERKLISAIERGASVLELQAMLQAGSNADARKLFIERTSNNLSCVGFVRRKKEEAAQRFNVPVIKELYRLYKADEFDGILNLFLIFIQRQFSNLKSGGDLPLEARELLAILNEYPPEEIRYVLRSYADAEKHACVLCCIRRKNIDLDGLDNVKAVADEMSAGAELRLRAREFSTIALWFAVAAGLDLRNKRIVEWVLKYGDKNDKNFCALMKIFGTEVEPVVVQVEPEWRAFQSSDDGIEEMVAVDPSPQSLDPMTTFVTCIMENNIQGAKDLLTEAKINFQNASTLFAGTTVFHLVIFYNRPEIAKLLHGYFGMGWVKDENNQLPEIYINLDAQDERRTHEQIVRIYANKLIFGAVILRRIEMLCHLVMDLQCNADASSNPGVETTPLDLLIERANKIPLDELEAMVKVLVMNGAHVKLSNIENAPQELKDFLESSYNTLHGLRNVETRLPRNENIRLALIFNNMSDVEYWVEKNGIDCKVDGSPAIFIVVKYMQISRSTDAFTYFLEKGVNTEVSDAEGITLQARVEACGSPKVIKLFKEHQERAGWKSPRAVSVAVVASSSPLDPNVTFVSYIVDGEGNLEGVRRLIEEEQVSGRVVRQDFVSAGLRALHLAVLHNRPGIAEYLVKEAGCLSLPDEHGRLPIHYITFGKTDERIVALFQNELVEKFVTEENREGIEALITRGINPLPVAVAKQKREIVRALVNDSRIDVNALDVNDSRGANGFAPVMLSVMSSDLEIVKYLVEEAKANLDIVDRITGYGLLHIAVCSRQLEVVRYLIGLGLIVNLGAVGNHKTPLDLLLEGNRFPEMRDFVELLVESGAEVISENIEAAPEEIKPYLREAMGRFLHRLVLDVEYVSLPRQFVGKSRAELEFRDHEGRTPLHVAIIHNRVGIVEYLYSQHAGIDLVDDFGWLPMDYIKFGETDEKIVELFKDALALQCVADNNVDGVDVFISRGVNPLSLLRAAVLQRKAEVTTHLLMDVHCDANGCANPETEKTLLDCILEMEEFPELETYVKLLVLNGAIVKLSNVQNAPESVEQFLHNSFQTLHGIQLSWKSPREVSAAVAHEHGSPVISPRALQEILTRVEEYEQRTEALEARFK